MARENQARGAHQELWSDQAGSRMTTEVVSEPGGHCSYVWSEMGTTRPDISKDHASHQKPNQRWYLHPPFPPPHTQDLDS